MDKLKHLVTPILLLAALMIVLPLIEWAGAAWPLGLGSAEWRFGAVGLLSNGLLQPLLGLSIIVVIATVSRKQRLQRALGVFNALAALVLLVLVPVFILDSLELRSRVPDGATLAFDVAAVRAIFVNGFAALVLASLSRGGFRSARESGTETRGVVKEPSPVISWSSMEKME